MELAPLLKIEFAPLGVSLNALFNDDDKFDAASACINTKKSFRHAVARHFSPLAKHKISCDSVQGLPYTALMIFLDFIERKNAKITVWGAFRDFLTSEQSFLQSLKFWLFLKSLLADSEHFEILRYPPPLEQRPTTKPNAPAR